MRQIEKEDLLINYKIFETKQYWIMNRNPRL
jgi:hypothetical protein